MTRLHNGVRPGSGVLSLRTSPVLPSVRAAEASPSRHPPVVA